MKAKLLIIVAVGLVLFPLIPLLQHHMGTRVMIDSFSVSGSIVWLISIVFSMISWSLFAWASKSIKVDGIPLSVISAAVLIVPFHDVLGPMASVIVGVVAGFVAFMFHKHMACRDKKSLMITIGTVVASYLAFTMMIILTSNSLHVWDTGNGIGTWSGTADGMEKQIHFDWITVETIWIVILIIPGAIMAYKFYERIKNRFFTSGSRFSK